ncbi:MAG: flagellar basal body-associated FliL family protein [Deltaproteobacteria bacterium]|nr:flagellar basal body-associated FliL family protein [Deltaproteobacteria bacterium]
MAEDEAKTAGGAEEPKKKSKAMLFIILGVAILLLGAGGFFAYTKFLAPKSHTAEESAEEEHAETAEAVGDIVALEPFVVNLADPKGNRYLKMKISLEFEAKGGKEGKEAKEGKEGAEPKGAAERIEKVAPKLRDIVIMMVTSLSFEEVMTPEGKLRIRDELIERFNRITKPDKVKNIYFSEFVVQ